MDNNVVTFTAKISKMGDNRVIWIPKSFAEMIKPWEDEKVLVKLMSTNTKVTQVEDGKYIPRNHKILD
jgi:antitoxin component of MazEF toxin-antitoxin module